MNDPTGLLDRRRGQPTVRLNNERRHKTGIVGAIEEHNQHYLNQARLALWPEVVKALELAGVAFDSANWLNHTVAVRVRNILAKIDRLEQK